MKHHPSWTALRSYAITAGLACLMGVSYELFVFPNAFAPAGINGLATMLQYLLHINIGYLSLLLGPVAAGVVSGAVYGWVIRQNGSTGGTDIVAAWVRKKHPEASLVWLIFSLNAAVAVLSFFVYGCQFEPVILCLIYSPFPADLRGEPPSGGSVPGDSGPLPGYLRLRLQCQ